MKTRRIPRAAPALLLLPALLAGCGGGGSGGDSPPPQPTPPISSGPSIEEEIAARLKRQSAFHAVEPQTIWRTGVTGKGVRIAIEDDPVDVLQDEFEGRIADEGTEITLLLFPQSTYNQFLQRGRVDWPTNLCLQGYSCRQFNAGSIEAGESRIRRALKNAGRYPSVHRRELWLLRVEDQELAPFHLVLNPGDKHRTSGEWVLAHGTWVASTAAGSRFGIAPGATIVPKAIPLDDTHTLTAGAVRLSRDILDAILYSDGPFAGVWNSSQIRQFDLSLAESIADDNRDSDITNRSYGISSWSDWNLRRQHAGRADFYDRLDERMPNTSAALQQANVAEKDKTLFVTAAGNESDWEDRTLPQPGAAQALFYPKLRGLAFAVAALGPNGRIASYSNLCGSPNRYEGEFAWNTARHGRHYCISAPGTVKARSPDGTVVTVSGTSFAAPIVSGALALMKEHFRGRLTPREIGFRMVNTADNTGVYADAAVYGAGALDLGAALRPVGSARTGLPGGTADLGATYLETPLAWGDVGARVGSVEIAAFDDWNAPFWSDLGSRFQAAAGSFPPPDPAQGGWDAPEAFALPHLAWTRTPGFGEGAALAWGLVFGASQKGTIDSFGLSAQPLRGSSLRFGLVYEGGANQGAKPSGAFGEGVSTRFVFASRDHARVLGNGPFSVEASWTLLAGRADYPSSAMVRAGAGLYTAGRIGLAHGGEDAKTRISVSQPLRAESGSGTLTFPHDRTLEGEWLYRSQRFDLAPDAREVRLALRHDREWGGGKLALEVGHAVDAGHRAGEDVRFAGLGYRLPW